MLTKRSGLRKPKHSKPQLHKKQQPEEHKIQLQSTGNAKTRISRRKIEEYLSSITKKENLPFSHLVHSNRVSKLEIFKHICTCFMGISETRVLKEIAPLINQHSVFLPTELTSGRKTLFLDLDETLIHTTLFPSLTNYGTVQLNIDGLPQTIYFNIRPYVYQFLNNLSKLYEIYIFTAAESIYAEAMTNFLNSKNKTISGYLSRQSCLKTSAGYYIKDLRIIKNRKPSEMILVDNLTLSFGETIENGIPILQFTNNQQDSQLIHLQEYLLKLVDQSDIRQTNKETWKLNQMGVIDSILKQIFIEV